MTQQKGQPNPRRAELRALSALVRPLVKAGMFENVNAGLIDAYTRETGQAEWHTFQDWRKLGRPVKKGERGFPIWGTPRRMKPGEGAIAGDLAQVAMMQGAEPQGPEWFPVAYLFHAGQVDAAQQAEAA